MNGNIGIFFRLVAIALTIAGSAADGDTTPAVLVEAAEPNAAINPERATDDVKVVCHSYKCGKAVYDPNGVKDVPCLDTPATIACLGNNMCQKIVLKGTEQEKAVDYLDAGCAYSPDQKTECEELPLIQKKRRLFEGDARICMCNSTLCNGPKSFSSESGSNESSSSEVSSSITFVTFAALFIAAKMTVV